MTRYGAVLNFSGPLPDGDGICDLTARVSKIRECCERRMRRLDRRCPAAPFSTSRLNEQATVNGFVERAGSRHRILGFSHPEICSGDQSESVYSHDLPNFTWIERRHCLGRKADSQASESAWLAR